MAVTLNPYLNWRGNARAAMEFYHSIFGGELTMSTYSEAGMEVDPSEVNQLMHSQLISDSGLVLMGSDAPMHIEGTHGSAFSVSLSGPDEDILRTYWDGLAVGASIEQPLTTAPWGDTFGMLVDQFGINWMVNILAEHG
ncbi:MAG: VOC family protein [Actinomycetota bacterium]|nr:VOC family protein [Actinomycetota bacterium]